MSWPFDISGAPWLPLIGEVPPTIYADFAASHYWFQGQVYATFAAWLIAIGGTSSGTLVFDNDGLHFTGTQSVIFPFTQTTFTVLAKTNGLSSTGGQNGVIIGNTTSQAGLFLSNSTLTFSWLGETIETDGPFFGSTILAPHKTAVSGNASGLTITTDGLTPVFAAHPLMGDPIVALSLGEWNDGAAPLPGNILAFGIWNGLIATAAELRTLTAFQQAAVPGTEQLRAGPYVLDQIRAVRPRLDTGAFTQPCPPARDALLTDEGLFLTDDFGNDLLAE